MLNQYKSITISHHNLNVDELGNFVIQYSDKEDLKQKLQEIKTALKIDELMYLSTCNRVEFICFSDLEFDADFLRQFFQLVNPNLVKDKLEKIGRFVTVHEGNVAINHLFEVASSMDSLVVGEREIFRQFREAYKQAKEFGITCDNLRLLERFTVNAAKDVYANTKIGEKPLSIVSLAVKAMMQQQVGPHSRILMIGAGETNTLMAKFLKKYSFDEISVFNRSIDNAKHIVDLLDAKAYHLSELHNYEKGFDVMIVCTAATNSIIDVELYKKLLQREKSPKLVIDLSVPNNVDAEVVKTFDFEYVDIEQLRKLATENLEFRKTELTAAKKILKKRLLEFNGTFQQRQLEKALVNVPEKIKEVKAKAMSSVYRKRLDDLDGEAKELIQEMMDYMEKKCISIPMKAAKDLIK